MGHGFDYQGRQYDSTGALRDWWTKADATEYQKRAKVLVDQFNEFEPLPGLHVNGELTLGENIADLTGLVIARQAYLLSLKGATPPTINDIPADQRFYMGWAQSWKAKERDESLRQQVLTNVHSPEMYRANGPVRNIPEFHAAFGVKQGDKMYLAPEKRVKIW
jgi:putative endopeptidase